MNKRWACFLLVFIFATCFSQQKEGIRDLLDRVKEASYYDSARLFKAGSNALEKAGKPDNGSAASEIFLYYGNYFFYTRNLDRASYYYERSLKEAGKANNAHMKGLANIRLSFLTYELGEKEVGEKELQALLDQAKKQKDPENVAELLNLTGIIKEENNRPREAVKLYMEGLAFSESNDLKYYPGVFRNNLGLIKYFSGQTEDAIIDFKKGLETAEKENNKRLASHIQINICVVYISQNKLKEASGILDSVLHYFRANNLPQELASAFLNVGSAFRSSGKNDQALLYSDSAIAVLTKYKLDPELTRAYLNKADQLIKLKRDKEAEGYIEKASVLAKKTGRLEDISSCYLLSYQLYSMRGDHKEALEDHIAYIRTKDSLEKTQTGKMLKEMQLKYDVQKKETELEKERTKTLLLEKTSQEERFMKWLVIAIALGAVSSLGGWFYIRYQRKLQEKQEYFSRQLMENSEAERLRIARDLHDDIGQSLSMVKSKVSVAGSKDLEEELGRVIEQTREISKNLYPSYLEKIGLVRSIARLVENIQTATNIECSFDVCEEAESLPMNTKMHIYRILQECVNNTIKHAHASALKISISKDGNDLQLIYMDNGRGIEEGKSINGIGMFSIQERAKIIKGTLHTGDKAHKGFKMILHIKNNNT